MGHAREALEGRGAGDEGGTAVGALPQVQGGQPSTERSFVESFFVDDGVDGPNCSVHQAFPESKTHFGVSSGSSATSKVLSSGHLIKHSYNTDLARNEYILVPIGNKAQLVNAVVLPSRCGQPYRKVTSRREVELGLPVKYQLTRIDLPLYGDRRRLWVTSLEGDSLHVIRGEHGHVGRVSLREPEHLVFPGVSFENTHMVMVTLDQKERSRSVLGGILATAVEGTNALHFSRFEGPTIPTPDLVAAVPFRPDFNDHPRELHVFTIEPYGFDQQRAVHRSFVNEVFRDEEFSKPFPATEPLPPYRLATYDASSGEFIVGFVGRDHSQGVIFFNQIEFKKDRSEPTTTRRVLPPAQQSAVRADVGFSGESSWVSEDILTVSGDGELMVSWGDREYVSSLRESVPLNYDFPFLFSSKGLYEVYIQQDGLVGVRR